MNDARHLIRLGLLVLLLTTACAPSLAGRAVTASNPARDTSVTATPRLRLAATDPSTVTLAAGKPQLVEFFAFW